jgi:dipeptidyl aminopeptidase/acylaminoacyl peptidase
MKRISSTVWWVFTVVLICVLGFNPMEGFAKGKIVFASFRSGNWDIWIMDEDGNNQLQLTFSPDHELSPAFSADGKKIAFINKTKNQLIVMDSDGNNKVPLRTSTYPEFRCPTWSPDGSKIAFRDGPYNYYDIWIINSDGTNPYNLTKDGMHNSLPSWSPDGTRIAYTRRDIPPYSYSEEVWVMNSNGTNKKKLTYGGWCGFTCSNAAPDWSPDSAKIAYHSGAYGHIVGNSMYPPDIYVMNPDGTGKKRITTFPGREITPKWSPTEHKIVFYKNRDLYIINPDGTGEERLTYTGDLSDEFDWGISPIEKVFADIKPGSCPNLVNLKSKGVLPVAVLGTEEFNITTINLLSIRLQGVAALRGSIEDVGTPYADPMDECDCSTGAEDGFADLTLKFDAQELLGALGSVSDGEIVVLTLTGELSDGTPIEGKDCITILSKGKKRK